MGPPIEMRVSRIADLALPCRAQAEPLSYAVEGSAQLSHTASPATGDIMDLPIAEKPEL